ncbi:MAG: protein kinase, partial [Acidobacteriota bacterium]
MASAHEKGIVHRDLKPGNIMVSSEDRVKVLDFGIAKLDPASELDQTDLQTQALTVDGRIIGTVPYMSPEQVKGESLDARSDIFSLGSIFFQMITGSMPFEGETPPEVLASILKDDPPLVTALRAEAPRQLGRIIQHCLAKDPKRRFQSARDLVNALGDLEQELNITQQIPVRERSQVTARKHRLVFWLGFSAALLVLVGVAIRFFGPKSETRNEFVAAAERPFEVEVGGLAAPLTQLTSASGLEEWPAWSPSGDLIALSAEVDGFKNLFLHDLSTGEERRLTTTTSDEIQAAWSVDGESLLFVRASGLEGKLNPSDIMGWYVGGGDIWRFDLESGVEDKLIDNAFNPAVAPDGSAILVDADWAGPRRIWRADWRGRNPKQVTNDSSEAAAHANASWSPDGRKIVYRRIQQTSSNIVVLDLETEAVSALTDDDHNDLDPTWSPDGRYVYFSSYRSGGLNLWRIPVTASGAPNGTAQQVTRGPGNDLQATLSPLGDRLAFSVLRLNSDLWRLPVDAATGEALGGPSEVFASSREDSRASWYPDASALVFNSDQAGDMNLWRLDLETSTTKQLTGGPGGDFQPKVSPDSSKVVFFSAR